MAKMKTLSLQKCRELFFFSYETGSEGKVLEAILDMVNRKDVNFTMSDAEIIAYKLGKDLAKEFKNRR